VIIGLRRVPRGRRVVVDVHLDLVAAGDVVERLQRTRVRNEPDLDVRGGRGGGQHRRWELLHEVQPDLGRQLHRRREVVTDLDVAEQLGDRLRVQDLERYTNVLRAVRGLADRDHLE